MEDIARKRQFIELRSLGWSYQRIADQMKLAKRTFINWGNEFKAEIQLKRQLELDDLWSFNWEIEKERLSVIRAQWGKLREVVLRKNLMRLTADGAMTLFVKLSDQLGKGGDGEERETNDLPADPEHEELRRMLFDSQKDDIL